MTSCSTSTNSANLGLGDEAVGTQPSPVTSLSQADPFPLYVYYYKRKHVILRINIRAGPICAS